MTEMRIQRKFRSKTDISNTSQRRREMNRERYKVKRQVFLHTLLLSDLLRRSPELCVLTEIHEHAYMSPYKQSTHCNLLLQPKRLPNKCTHRIEAILQQSINTMVYILTPR
jgi:hypothetical protein